MNKKCRICGYRFKSADENICPECFTARENDISCEHYSYSVLSHAKGYSSGMSDSGESFVQKELREERHNKFAKENFDESTTPKFNSSSFDSYDTSRFARNDFIKPSPYAPPMQNNAPSGFTAAGQNLVQRLSFNNPQNFVPYQIRLNNVPKKVQNRKKGAAALVYLFVVVFILTAIINSVVNYQSSSNRNTTTYTQRTTTVQSAGLNTDYSTSDGCFTARVASVSFDYPTDTEIPQELKKRAIDYTKQTEPWKLANIKVRIYPSENFDQDQISQLISSASLYSFDSPDFKKQLGFSSVIINEPIEITKTGTDVIITVLINKNASYANLTFSMLGIESSESFRFFLHL